MNRNNLRDFCLNLTAAVEEFPFGPDAAVFKVMGKMFALIPVAGDPPSISLKSDPVEAVMLRQMYAAVQAGYHMNKKHWNTIILDVIVPQNRMFEWIDESYSLVVAGLKKSERKMFEK